MDPDPEGDKEVDGGVGRNKGIGDADDANEKDAAWSLVFFSSEKETKEPWPLLPAVSLGDVVIDPDPEYYLYLQTNKHTDDNNK